MLYLHFLQSSYLVYEIGDKKSKSTYLFISNKHEYLEFIWNPWTEICEKHLRVVNWEFENFCKLNKNKRTLKLLPSNTLFIVIKLSKVVSSRLSFRRFDLQTGVFFVRVCKGNIFKKKTIVICTFCNYLK